MGPPPGSSPRCWETYRDAESILRSEAVRLRPPSVNPVELEVLAADPRPPLPVVATFACLQLVLRPELVSTPGRGLRQSGVKAADSSRCVFFSPHKRRLEYERNAFRGYPAFLLSLERE